MRSLLKVFLAGRQSRRSELIEYRKQMEEQGLVSCASWLDDNSDCYRINGDGLVVDPDGESLNVDSDTHRRLREGIAQEAFDDVFACDIFILFTEADDHDGREMAKIPPFPTNNTRLAQLGIALARHKQVIMVGWRRETLVGWMRRVTHVQTWEEALILISRRALEGIGAVEPASPVKED